MAEMLSKSGWPKWALSAVVLLGFGWGVRVKFVEELEKVEARCQLAVSNAEKRAEERYQTKLEAAQNDREIDRAIHAVLAEARQIR